MLHLLPIPTQERYKIEADSNYNAAKTYVLKSIRWAEEKQRPDIKRGEELVKRMIDSIAKSSALLLLAAARPARVAGFRVVRPSAILGSYLKVTI